jgi:hypothetical protein
MLLGEAPDFLLGRLLNFLGAGPDLSQFFLEVGLDLPDPGVGLGLESLDLLPGGPDRLLGLAVSGHYLGQIR